MRILQGQLQVMLNESIEHKILFFCLYFLIIYQSQEASKIMVEKYQQRQAKIKISPADPPKVLLKSTCDLYWAWNSQDPTHQR